MAKRLEAAARMKEMMLRHFQAGWLAREEGGKCAFVTSGAPVEFLHAMDVVPVCPESHGAVGGVARAGGRLCQAAEERGYSRDLCAYWKVDWGARTIPAASPIGGLPKPDFLFCANNICRTVVKWYEGLSRFYRVPLLLLDMPFRHGEEEPAAREYVREQFRNIPGELARLTGRTWDGGRFRESVDLSREASVLWQECIEANSARPAPATAADQFLMMGPIVTMRGTREAVGFYRELAGGIRERVGRGEGAIEAERFRLLWDNLPVWHQLRPLSDFLADRGVVLVGATYTDAWTERAAKSPDGTDAVDFDGRGHGGRTRFRRGCLAPPPRGIRRTTGQPFPSGEDEMRKAPSCFMLVMMLLLAAALPTVSRGAEPETRAELLWNERGDLGKAAEAIGASEEVRKDNPLCS